MTNINTTNNATFDIEAISENGKMCIAFTINGEKGILSLEDGLNASALLEELTCKHMTEETMDVIERPEYWQDYLLDAGDLNVNTSLLAIEDDVWVIHHNNIREFIQDYRMDSYSQICSNTKEMKSNGLISPYKRK